MCRECYSYTYYFFSSLSIINSLDLYLLNSLHMFLQSSVFHSLDIKTELWCIASYALVLAARVDELELSFLLRKLLLQYVKFFTSSFTNKKLLTLNEDFLSSVS